jgi:hypothetical protein
MPKYMVLYRSSMPAEQQMGSMSPEQAKEGMELWMKWAGEMGKALVDFGMPLGKGNVVEEGSARSADASIGGYSIIEADSLGAATKMVENHPHFHSPGASIEVLEFLPAPGM